MLPDAVGEHAPAFPLTFYLGTTGSKGHGASRLQKPPLTLQIQASLLYSLFTRDTRAAHPASLAAHEAMSQLRRSYSDDNCGRCAKSLLYLSVPLLTLDRSSQCVELVAKMVPVVKPRLYGVATAKQTKASPAPAIRVKKSCTAK